MVDRYTKGVLTVIAAALVTIAAQHAILPSHAASDADIQKVQICDDSGRCADLTPHVNLSHGSMSWVIPVAVEEIPNK